jgi:hypothetical protein
MSRDCEVLLELLLPSLREMHAEGYALGADVMEHPMRRGLYRFTDKPNPVPLAVFYGLTDEEEKPNLPRTSISTEDIQRAKEAIKCIPADDRDVWMMVGRAFHHATNGADEGFEIWTAWSQGSAKFHRREQRRQWKYFKQDEARPTTFASVFELAREFGWIDGSHLLATTGLAAIAKSTGSQPNILPQQQCKPCDGNSQNGSTILLPHSGMRLTDLAAHLEAMADGSAKPMYYLSSLDPGVGKTQTISHFMSALQRSPGAQECWGNCFCREKTRNFLLYSQHGFGRTALRCLCIGERSRGSKAKPTGQPSPRQSEAALHYPANA